MPTPRNAKLLSAQAKLNSAAGTILIASWGTLLCQAGLLIIDYLIMRDELNAGAQPTDTGT